MTNNIELNESIFKEYDIRGIVDKDLHPYVVKLIAYFLGKRILQNNGTKVCVAYDIREHSPLVCSYIVSGFNASGVSVYSMGMSATPVNYFANYIQEQEFDSTVMITASHNPREYNGFKMTLDKKPFFGDEIQDLKRDIQQAIKENMQIPDNTDFIEIDINKKYIKFMVEKFAHLKNLKHKILLDSGNGSVGFLIDDIFAQLGLEFEHLFKEPDGTFPNHHPDPSNAKNLEDIHSRIKNFDIAFAYDGDGDRLAVLTNEHNIKGDILAIIFAKQMKNPIVVGEVKCSSVMYEQINKIGKAVMYKTGHSNIKTKIQEIDATFGAEVSGHMFFNDEYFGYDDAIYSTFRVLDLIYKNINLDDEISKIPLMYSTDELGISVIEEQKFEIIKNVSKEIISKQSNLPTIKNIIDIDGLRIEFEHGWALVRASNTTPTLVTRFEALTKENLELYQKSINLILRKYI